MTIKINANAAITLIAGAGIAALAFLGYKSEQKKQREFKEHKEEALKSIDIYKDSEEVEKANDQLEVADRVDLKILLAERRALVRDAKTIDSLDKAIDIWKSTVRQLSNEKPEDNLVYLRYEMGKINDAKKAAEEAKQRAAEKDNYRLIADSISSLTYGLRPEVSGSNSGVSLTFGK